MARIAQESGADRIFVDMEWLGKEKRQRGMDTVKSHHTLSDVRKLRRVVRQAELLVRVNSINPDSRIELEETIRLGADVIMLPYFKSILEVEFFLETVNGRSKTCLLIETPQAVECVDEILALGGFDEIHIGLNDLCLGYGRRFMFELLADGTVESLCRKFQEKGLFYGFGGIAQIGKGLIPAEKIIAEHYRLGSGMAILSRSFCNASQIQDPGEMEEIFSRGIGEIRRYERTLPERGPDWLEENHQTVCRLVKSIVEGI